MKIIRIFFMAIFSTIIILPIIFFNFTPDSISEIDNRKLAENPFEQEGDFIENLENYVNDRIGFREEMITEYIILNDKLFGKMVHPSYSYGKDGYVFGGGVSVDIKFTDYHVVFANMVEAVQSYCSQRGIPFLFVFNPAKPAVYEDKIADGIKYNRDWVYQLFEELKNREVRFIDNTEVLKDLRGQKNEGFNKMYDANHWNETGAFYGTRAMLEEFNKDFPCLHVNDLSDFELSWGHRSSLLVSKFPIDEKVPFYKSKIKYENIGKNYPGLEMHPSYKTYGYYVNEQRKSEGSPKALVFQGSYMNSYGGKFLASAFSEYIYVHDYQNIINFPYYYNIFQPDCVIFEVAEYTVRQGYFNLNNMKKIDYNPLRQSIDQTKIQKIEVDNSMITYQEDGVFTTVTLPIEQEYKYVWMNMDIDYDMRKCEGGYQVTLQTETINQNESPFVFYAYSEGE